MEAAVFLDEEHRIRVLNTESHAASKSLQENCMRFVTNVQQLQDRVSKFMSAVDQQVEKIEAERLKAVGLRHRVSAVGEERRRKQQELQQVMKEKQDELNRLLAEEKSLLLVKQEQLVLLARLSDPSGSA